MLDCMEHFACWELVVLYVWIDFIWFFPPPFLFSFFIFFMLLERGFFLTYATRYNCFSAFGTFVTSIHLMSLSLNYQDALRHVFASRIAEIKKSPQWNRLSFVSCAFNNLILMDESLHLLPAVETLDLSSNKLARVDNLRKCSKLRHLDLGFNNLRTISSFGEVD